MAFGKFRIQRKSVFRYPMDPAPRTAVLAACFRQARFPVNAPIRIFPQGWSQKAAAFAPAAVAATRQQLLDLAAVERPPLITHAVIVLQGFGDRPLAPDERELLWRAFRVPVFQQIIGPRGELLAAECEAHDGLHVETHGLAWEGYGLDSTPCGCGRKTPRLVPAESADRVRRMAAYAR